MYKKVIDIQYRNSLANELMMFHMKVTTTAIPRPSTLAVCQPSLHDRVTVW